LGVRWVLAAPAALALGRPALPGQAVAFHPRGVALLAARPLGAADDAPAGPGEPAPLIVLCADIGAAAAARERAIALDAEPVTPSRYLARAPRHPVCEPAALAGADAAARGPFAGPGLPMLRALRQLEAALAEVVRRERRPRRVAAGPHAASELLRRRALVQAAREGLLAACGEWPGLGEYGARRFRAHAGRGLELLAALRGAAPLDAAYLAEVESRDPHLEDEVDASWFAS
ncbi:MAG TPA: 1,4-alpha-glucan branching protein domain-containing protein, partial [Polyangia bacterium]